MGEGGGIDDDAGGALASAVNPVDKLIFAIALMKLDRKPKLAANTAAVRLDVGQRLAAIDLRLALAEQVEIGPVQDHDDRTHALPPATTDLVLRRCEAASKDGPVHTNIPHPGLSFEGSARAAPPQDEALGSRRRVLNMARAAAHAAHQ